MITVIDSTNHHLHADTLRDFAALRYEIFINRLAWPLDCEPGFETDQFDGPDAVYLIIQNPRGQVVAGSRMLNTAKPSLLKDVFSHLVDGETPVHPDIWDVTRFAVDHRRDRLEGCGNVCAELLTGMIEWGVSVASQRFVSVSDVRVEPILRRAGWRFLRIGKVLEMDGTGVTALSHQVNEEVLADCRRRASISTKLLTRDLIREAA